MAKECRKKQRDSKRFQLVETEEPHPEASVGLCQSEETNSSNTYFVMPVEASAETPVRAPLEVRAPEESREARQVARRQFTGKIFLVTDSGSQICALPIELVRGCDIEPQVSKTIVIESAGGNRFAYFGRVLATIRVDEFLLVMSMEVATIERPFISVGEHLKHGAEIQFCRDESVLVATTSHREPAVIPLQLLRGICGFWGDVVSVQLYTARPPVLEGDDHEWVDDDDYLLAIVIIALSVDCCV